MIHVLGQDEFGLSDHLESCGGGIEAGEREPGCRPGSVEELGAVLTVGSNWADRRRISSAPAAQSRTFFVAHCKPVLHPPRVDGHGAADDGGAGWLCPEEVERRLNPENNQGIGLLIARRDFCAWQEAVRRHQISKKRILGRGFFLKVQFICLVSYFMLFLDGQVRRRWYRTGAAGRPSV